MNRLKHILPILLTVLLAASCDKDSLPGEPASGERKEVTFSVGIEQTEPAQPAVGKRMATRAPGADTDDRPTRCFMQVLDADGRPQSKVLEAAGSDNYTFTVSLTPGEYYNYLFYADNGKMPVDELYPVRYQPGTIAFAAMLYGTPEEVSRSVELKHIVTKLTLRHNGEHAFTAAEGEVLTATVPMAHFYYYGSTRYNDSQSLKHMFDTDFTADSPTDICSFYTLVPTGEGSQSIRIGFRNLEMKFTDLPLTADSHIILSGDFSENNGKWTGTPEYYKQVFTDAFYKDGKPFGVKNEFERDIEYHYYASDADSRRIIEKILKTTVSEKPQEVTTPWGSKMHIHYLPDNVLHINNVGHINKKMIRFGIHSMPIQVDKYPHVNLPDKIY